MLNSEQGVQGTQQKLNGCSVAGHPKSKHAAPPELRFNFRFPFY
jgi:hypothetical protein